MANIALWEGMDWGHLNTVLTEDWEGMRALLKRAIESLNKTLVSSTSLEEVQTAFFRKRALADSLVSHVTPREWVEISHLANR